MSAVFKCRECDQRLRVDAVTCGACTAARMPAPRSYLVAFIDRFIALAIGIALGWLVGCS